MNSDDIANAAPAERAHPLVQPLEFVFTILAEDFVTATVDHELRGVTDADTA